jgi:hypothetical protein
MGALIDDRDTILPQEQRSVQLANGALDPTLRQSPLFPGEIRRTKTDSRGLQSLTQEREFRRFAPLRTPFIIILAYYYPSQILPYDPFARGWVTSCTKKRSAMWACGAGDYEVGGLA